MSSGPENKFIAAIHRLLPASVYHMKNHNVYTGGVADVWYSGRLGDLWIEYKFTVLPKRPGTIVSLVNDTKPMLSMLQQEWLRDRRKEGRDVAVVLGTPEGGIWFRGDEWDKPHRADALRALLLSKNEIAKTIQARVDSY